MLGFTFRASDTMRIRCYHCGADQEVGRRAQTVTCQKCHKSLTVTDVKVKGYDARRKVQTVASVIVEKRGQVVADTVECGGLIVRGQLTAKQGVDCSGPVLVGAQAVLKGNVGAPTIAVGAGASLDGFYCVGKDKYRAPDPTPTPTPLDPPDAEGHPSACP